MTNNQAQIQIIIGTVALLAVICIGTICVLACYEKAIPPELNTLAGGLSGGLMAMLVKTTPTEPAKTSVPTV